jgi:hypothetical protein
MSNYFYDLPKELQYEICQYIPYKRPPPYFIHELQEIVMDWYNKALASEHEHIINRFKTFQENGGLNTNQSEYFKSIVFRHANESRYYHLLFCHSAGQFKRVARKIRLSKVKSTKNI